MTPVLSQLGLFNLTLNIFSYRSCAPPILGDGEDLGTLLLFSVIEPYLFGCTEVVGAEGVASPSGAEESLFTLDTRDCRRVMFPRNLRISSTL